MKICLEIPDEKVKNLLKEAFVNTLSFDDLLLHKIAVPYRDLEKGVAKIKKILDTDIPAREPKPVGVVGLATQRRQHSKMTDDFERETAARIPQTLIEDIMRERRVTIQHVYRLAECPPPHYRFTLMQLIDCLPIKCTDFVTANQERGWPAPFHKFMHEEMHVDYDATVQPIVYWRTRD